MRVRYNGSAHLIAGRGWETSPAAVLKSVRLSDTQSRGRACGSNLLRSSLRAPGLCHIVVLGNAGVCVQPLKSHAAGSERYSPFKVCWNTAFCLFLFLKSQGYPKRTESQHLLLMEESGKGFFFSFHPPTYFFFFFPLR